MKGVDKIKIKIKKLMMCVNFKKLIKAQKATELSFLTPLKSSSKHVKTPYKTQKNRAEGTGRAEKANLTRRLYAAGSVMSVLYGTNVRIGFDKTSKNHITACKAEELVLKTFMPI